MMHARVRASKRRLVASVVTVLALLLTCMMAAQPASAAFAGSNGLVAFQRVDMRVYPATYKIWLSSPGNPGGEQPITSGTGVDRAPAWSRDGKTLCFPSSRSGTSRIYTIDPTKPFTEILMAPDKPSSRYEDNCSFRPDGWIGFNTAYDLLVRNPVTGVEKVLVGGPEQDMNPVFSDDGQWMAHLRRTYDGPTPQRVHLILRRADGSNPVELHYVDSSGGIADRLSFHPNSSLIEWEVKGADQRERFFRVSTSGVVNETIRSTPCSRSWAATPEGDGLVLTNCHNGVNIWTADLNGVPLVQVSDADGVNDLEPAIQPVGNVNTHNDITPPVLTVTSPLAGEEVLQGASRLVEYSATDESGGSGMDYVSATLDGVPLIGGTLPTSTLGQHVFVATASDKNGNVASQTVTYTVVAPPPPDSTPPTISIVSPVELSEVTQGASLVADFSCDDNVGVTSCVGTVPDGSVIDTSTLGVNTFTVTASDAAGNTAGATFFYTVVAPPPPSDTEKPTIAITSPSGADIVIGSSLTAQYSCTDNVGTPTCVGDVAVGAALDTSTVGVKSFTVNSVDAAGNTATKTVNYSVVWPFGGFAAPVDGNGVLNVTKAGGVVPVKFSLGSDRGLAILAAGYPKSSKTDCTSGAEADPLEIYASSSPGNNTLSYDATTGLYGYNWKTEKSWANSCRQFVLRLADGEEYRASFQFK